MSSHFDGRGGFVILALICLIFLFGTNTCLALVAGLGRFVWFIIGHPRWLVVTLLLSYLVACAFQAKKESVSGLKMRLASYPECADKVLIYTSQSASSPLSSDGPPPEPSDTGARVPDIFLYGKLKSEHKDELDPPAHRHTGPCPTPYRYEPIPFGLSNFHNNRFGASSGRAPSANGTPSSYWSHAPVTPPRPALFQPKFGLHPTPDRYEPARFGLSNFRNDHFGIGLGRAPNASGTSSSWARRGPVTASRPSLFQPKIFGEAKRQQRYPYFDMPRPASPIFAPKSRPSGTVPTYAPPSPAATQPRPFFGMQQPLPAPAAPAGQHPVGLGGDFRPSPPSLTLGGPTPTSLPAATLCVPGSPMAVDGLGSDRLRQPLPSVPSLRPDDLAPIPHRNSALWAPRSPVAKDDSAPDVPMRSALRPSSYMRHPRVSAGEIIRLRLDLNDMSISMPAFRDEEMRGPVMGDMDVDRRAPIEHDVAMAPPVAIEEDVRMSSPRLWY
ncbi:hypothetical protein FS749_004611 [Ceratobasidium sp. UAMH 11750]|nr:hypothetical protein FS749_004611 [Ceratobasidium sp. UAMH 11750]